MAETPTPEPQGNTEPAPANGESDSTLLEATPPIPAKSEDGNTALSDPPPAKEGDTTLKKEGDTAAPGKEDETLLAQREGAPEKYEAFNIPETVSVDDDTMTEFGTLMKELDLPQGQAQQIIDLQIKAQVAQSEADMKQAEEWKAEIQKNPKHAEELQHARNFLNNFADKDVKELFQGSWLGNHPGVISLFARAGRATGEDQTIEGAKLAPNKEPVSPGRTLFPSMNP